MSQATSTNKYHYQKYSPRHTTEPISNTTPSSTSSGAVSIPQGPSPPVGTNTPGSALGPLPPPSSRNTLQLPNDSATASGQPTIVSDTSGASITITPASQGDIFSSVIITSSPSSIFTLPSLPASQTSGIVRQPVCIGSGLDAGAQGILASLIVSSVIGLFIWFLFGTVRPRFRQVYGLREWFVQQDLRPQPLDSSFFSFLFPHVPLVPPIPPDVSDAGRSAINDAEMFPSDEQLNQRAVFICLLIVFGWTILGLVGALPLYLVETPCLAQMSISTEGVYTALHDLSLLRLLRVIDDSAVRATDFKALQSRTAPTTGEGDSNARVRIIVLTAMTILLAVLPGLIKIIRELNTALAYRKRWKEVKCGGRDLAWLSARLAPGFAVWGEKRLKDFLTKNGLSSGFNSSDSRTSDWRRYRSRRSRRPEEEPLSPKDNPDLEVDIQHVFSVSDTQQLALLIEERDEILENLEIAETKYIGSFEVTTPEPSVTEFEQKLSGSIVRPHISLPLPLGNGTQRGRRMRRTSNPAFAASSLTPTSFVAPSSYYKLRGVGGVSGGRFGDSEMGIQPGLTESINSCGGATGRFQNVSRNPEGYGHRHRHVTVETSGNFGNGSNRGSIIIPDPRLYGPNFSLETTYEVDEHGVLNENEGWVDVSQVHSGPFETDFNGVPPTRQRPKKEKVASEHRETFALRDNTPSTFVPPPHLRLQPSQPFVRPTGGVHFDELGLIYADITEWRSKLKAINQEVADAQRDCYSRLAEGTDIKGWLLTGRGLRHLQGVQLIEGRAKEDIRWDVLQNERTLGDWFAVFAVLGVIGVLLIAALSIVAGLAISTAPNGARTFPFLRPLLTTGPLASGIATVYAPSIGANLFLLIALFLINGTLNIHGSISISAGQLKRFKVVFYFFAIASTFWIVAVGAILFSVQALVDGRSRVTTIANGSVYMGLLATAIVLNMAIIFPGVIILQPIRLWRVARAERNAITPRQRFRALYPRVYNPAYTIGPCVLAIVFAAIFALIFPLIGLAVTLLLLLTLVAHRFLVGYVYVRTHSQTGGIIYIWLLKRLGTLLSLQPICLGLILLSREFWIEGGILVGTGVLVILFVEAFVVAKNRKQSRKSLAPTTQNSLDTFAGQAKNADPHSEDEQGSLFSGSQTTRARGSMASVLEMMSLTLAVMPSSSQIRGPVPLKTETLDDLSATERAARTHPEAPPHLPPLPFVDHAEEMAGILYAPELIAPPPIIWLPKDSAGIARSEAVDLQKYHDLQVTLDVRAQEDVMPQRSPSRARANA